MNSSFSPYLLLAGVAAGLIAALWSKIQTACGYLLKLVVDTRTLAENLSQISEPFLTDRARRISPKPFVSQWSFWDVKLGKSRPFLIESIGGAALFWYQGAPVWIRGPIRSRTISAIRGWTDLDKLLQAALDVDHARDEQNWSDSAARSRFCITILQGNLGEDIFAGGGQNVSGNATAQSSGGSSPSSMEGSYNWASTCWLPHGVRTVGFGLDDILLDAPRSGTVDSLVLSPGGREVLEDFRQWKSSETWYTARDIPWKRGWLFTGLPGTGKTSLAVAIAKDLKVPLLILDLPSMSNRDLKTKWDQVRYSSPCIVLIEDFDSVYDGRNLREERRGPSFDRLLNTLGGADNTQGVGLIITTNKPEALDEAICVVDRNGRASRPGRIDRAMNFGNTTHEQRHAIAAKVLDEHEDLQQMVVEAGHHDTPAQFVNRCRDVALARKWNDPEPVAGRISA